jgi:hypothetical protein
MVGLTKPNIAPHLFWKQYTGCVWVSAVMMIPANAGPQGAREVARYSHSMPLVCAALKENRNPEVMAKVMAKKAVIWWFLIQSVTLLQYLRQF